MNLLHLIGNYLREHGIPHYTAPFDIIRIECTYHKINAAMISINETHITIVISYSESGDPNTVRIDIDPNNPNYFENFSKS